MSFASSTGEALKSIQGGKDMVIFVVCRTHFSCRRDNRLEGHRCDWQTFPSRPEPRRTKETKVARSGDISCEKGVSRRLLQQSPGLGGV